MKSQKFEKTKIILGIFSNHNSIKLEINNRRKTGTFTNAWMLNNTFLNNQWIKNKSEGKWIPGQVAQSVGALKTDCNDLLHISRKYSMANSKYFLHEWTRLLLLVQHSNLQAHFIFQLQKGSYLCSYKFLPVHFDHRLCSPQVSK